MRSSELIALRQHPGPEAAGARSIMESLLLVSSVSVLEDTLRQLHHEGAFVCAHRGLKDLMTASRRILPWRDYTKIDAIRERRNAIAHRGQMLVPHEGAPYLEAIARELMTWHVLETDARGESTTTLTPSR